MKSTLKEAALLVLVLAAGQIGIRPAWGQAEPPKDVPNPVIEIPEEPATIDPATVVPKVVAKTATVKFEGTSLKEVLSWLEKDQKLSITIDTQALAQAKILLSEPITDSLNEEPIYLLLDRLRSVGLGWYLADKRIQITSLFVANSTRQTVYYNIGELRDAGYDAEELIDAIKECTGDDWDASGEKGELVLLGDVLFIRQSPQIQREVAGLLAAISSHGKRTLTLDPPQHAALQQKLLTDVTVELVEVPLDDAILQIAAQVQADIRLDHVALAQKGIRERTPVSIEVKDQRLHSVLHALVAPLELTWMLRDGVIWITLRAIAQKDLHTAVYDVRDLCRDKQEAYHLQNAVMSQTGGTWTEESEQGLGSISFARPGSMVVRQTQAQLNEVLQLLDNYRFALRSSKPRVAAKDDPNEVLTHFYRVPTIMADELKVALPKMVAPETWKSDERADAPGTIQQMASRPRLLDSTGLEVIVLGDEEGIAVVVPYSVLIIKQQRKVHVEIAEFIQNVEEGDKESGGGFGGGGGGLGGSGGFGGGLFNVVPQEKDEPRQK